MVTENANQTNYLGTLPDQNLGIGIGHILGPASRAPGAKVLGRLEVEGMKKLQICSAGGARRGKCDTCKGRAECPEVKP